jgi:peptidoglycan/xylan/chitin deacetylase (PgdA/CDA1 family)
MRQPLTFEYSSVHGALAAAYTSGALAAEFGPDQVRVALTPDYEIRGWGDPLVAELPLGDAEIRRYDTRLLGIVTDGDSPAWALLTTHRNLDQNHPLLARALSAVLQARPHRRPTLTSALGTSYDGWIAEGPLRAAHILIIEDFVAGAAPLAA